MSQGKLEYSLVSPVIVITTGWVNRSSVGLLLEQRGGEQVLIFTASLAMRAVWSVSHELPVAILACLTIKEKRERGRTPDIVRILESSYIWSQTSQNFPEEQSGKFFFAEANNQNGFLSLASKSINGCFLNIWIIKT